MKAILLSIQCCCCFFLLQCIWYSCCENTTYKDHIQDNIYKRESYSDRIQDNIYKSGSYSAYYRLFNVAVVGVVGMLDVAFKN